MTPSCVPKNDEANVLTQQGTESDLTPREVQEEVRKYLKLMPQVIEPNLTRVQEIKELVRQGAYLNQELIEETASRLALRFLRKE